MKQSTKVGLVVAMTAVVVSGCGIDKNSPKYDQLRYEQLQKTRCVDMATVLSSEFVTKEPENYDAALKRCEDMRTLTFDEYRRLADHARATGSWDIYKLYPEKKSAGQNNRSNQ